MWFLALAWLAKPKSKVVIPKGSPRQNVYRIKRVKVRSTACHYATKKPVKTTMHLGFEYHNYVKVYNKF